MISSASAIFGLSATGTHTNPWIEGSASIGLGRTEMELPTGNIAFTSSLFLQDAADVATLDLTDFSTTTDPAASVVATLTTALSGFNNDLVFTAVPDGEAGNAITITYTTPVLSGYETTARLTRDTQITVTLATKARMTVTGFTGSAAGANQTYHYDSVSNGRPKYVGTGGYEIAFEGGNWIIRDVTPGPTVIYSIGSAPQNAATPDLITSWTSGPSIGSPTVTAGVSSAAQVAAAIAANSDCLDIVSVANAFSNDGTGAVTAMSATALSGGIDANGWKGAALDYQGDAFQTPDAILGILIWCSAGSLTIAELSAELEQDEKFQRSRATGVANLLGATLTVTAGEDNSRLYIAVIGKA